jgi:hypothetical protein
MRATAPTKRRSLAFAWGFSAVAAICLAASLDSAGELGHWALRRIWRLGASGPAETSVVYLMVLPILQKALHVIQFGILGTLAALNRERRARAFAMAAGAITCVLAEWIQVFTKTRTASWSDVALNIIAFATAMALTSRSFANAANRAKQAQCGTVQSA